jgi:hypothetical protein
MPMLAAHPHHEQTPWGMEPPKSKLRSRSTLPSLFKQINQHLTNQPIRLSGKVEFPSWQQYPTSLTAISQLPTAIKFLSRLRSNACAAVLIATSPLAFCPYRFA